MTLEKPSHIRNGEHAKKGRNCLAENSFPQCLKTGVGNGSRMGSLSRQFNLEVEKKNEWSRDWVKVRQGRGLLGGGLEGYEATKTKSVPPKNISRMVGLATRPRCAAQLGPQRVRPAAGPSGEVPSSDDEQWKAL